MLSLVHFTAHALQRMALRQVSRVEVELVLIAPAETTEHRHGTTSHPGFTFDGRAIVVVTDSDDTGRIVTVMLDPLP